MLGHLKETKPNTVITIKHINIEALKKDAFNRMYSILIHAYAKTESEIWGPNYVRISEKDFVDIIKRGEVYGAFIKGTIVGSVRLFKKDQQLFSFGLLSADFNLKGIGIGGALVDYIENVAQKEGGSYMQIEILRAIEADVPFKKALKTWYTRLGYKYIKSAGFAELKPENAEKAGKLIQPCVFDCYQKVLNG